MTISMPKNLGLICLALFLIVYGLLAVTNIRFVWSDAILGVLALLAGILLLVGK